MIKNYSEFNKIKVSFDFDDTLALTEVQDFIVSNLLDRDLEIHIVTSRIKNLSYFSKEYREMYNPILDHSMIYSVAKKLNIKRKNIHFTNKKPKSTFFVDNPDFLFHLDDDMNEVYNLNNDNLVKTICVQYDNWGEEILKIINE